MVTERSLTSENLTPLYYYYLLCYHPQVWVEGQVPSFSGDDIPLS